LSEITIQFKRGLEADRTLFIPLVAEPVYTTDTKKLYIGDGITPGGNEITGGANNLNQLSDVSVITALDKNVLAYNIGTGKFENKTAAGAGLAEAVHDHNTIYYTKVEVDTLISAGPGGPHTHTTDDIDDIVVTTPSEGDVLIYQSGNFVNKGLYNAGIAARVHDHDGRYYTKTEVDTMVGSPSQGSDVTLSTGSFNNVLSALTDTAQKAFDKIDDVLVDDNDLQTVKVTF
jgi:hypothetical protein